jgi:hypothetical protein
MVENVGDEETYLCWCQKLLPPEELGHLKRNAAFVCNSGRWTIDQVTRHEMASAKLKRDGKLPKLRDLVVINDQDIKTSHELEKEASEFGNWENAAGWIPGGTKQYHCTSVRSLGQHLFLLRPLLRHFGGGSGDTEMASGWRKMHAWLFQIKEQFTAWIDFKDAVKHRLPTLTEAAAAGLMEWLEQNPSATRSAYREQMLKNGVPQIKKKKAKGKKKKDFRCLPLFAELVSCDRQIGIVARTIQDFLKRVVKDPNAMKRSFGVTMNSYNLEKN